jgi:hypothetical protein
MLFALCCIALAAGEIGHLLPGHSLPCPRSQRAFSVKCLAQVTFLQFFFIVIADFLPDLKRKGS